MSQCRSTFKTGNLYNAFECCCCCCFFFIVVHSFILTSAEIFTSLIIFLSPLIVSETRECVYAMVCIASVGLLRVMKWAVSNAWMEIMPTRGLHFFSCLSVHTLQIGSSRSMDSSSQRDPELYCLNENYT